MIKGYLIEYKKKKHNPLALEFEFNPQDLSFSRSLNAASGTKAQKAYGFNNPEQAAVAAWGVSSDPMTFTVKILLDSSYRIASTDKSIASMAAVNGIQPELDLLNLMTTFGSGDNKKRRALAVAAKSKTLRHKPVPVLLFGWGDVVFPVLVTHCSVNLTGFMPDLTPLRAEATINLKVIEGDNPIYLTEQLRQVSSAAKYSSSVTVSDKFEG